MPKQKKSISEQIKSIGRALSEEPFDVDDEPTPDEARALRNYVTRIIRRVEQKQERERRWKRDTAPGEITSDLPPDRPPKIH